MTNDNDLAWEGVSSSNYEDKLLGALRKKLELKMILMVTLV